LAYVASSCLSSRTFPLWLTANFFLLMPSRFGLGYTTVSLPFPLWLIIHPFLHSWASASRKLTPASAFRHPEF
jgi:hypothetical protein